MDRHAATIVLDLVQETILNLSTRYWLAVTISHYRFTDLMCYHGRTIIHWSEYLLLGYGSAHFHGVSSSTIHWRRSRLPTKSARDSAAARLHPGRRFVLIWRLVTVASGKAGAVEIQGICKKIGVNEPA